MKLFQLFEVDNLSGLIAECSRWERGLLPLKRLMGMCRWMGSHFEAAFHQVKTRYKVIKNQQETILGRPVDDSTDTGEDLLLTTRKLGD